MASEAGESELPFADLVELTTLFREHSPRLRSMLDRRIDGRFSPKFEASDLLSELFLRAQKKWPKFLADRIAPLGWLYGIGLDCLRERVRRETRPCRDSIRDEVWPERSSIAVVKGLFATSTTASKAMERSEVRVRVREAIEQLEPDDREILHMTHFDALSTEEIGAALDLKPVAVYQRLSRALRRLKPLLADLA